MFNTKERTRTRSTGQHHRHVPPGGLPNPSQNKNHKNNRNKSPHGGVVIANNSSNVNNVNNVNVNNVNVNKWGSRTSNTMPNPIIRPRVQAGAGDKCVAPAKSKQKRRQGVPGRPVDHSTLSMDAVIWSDEVYTVDQLVHAYGAKLPVIAKVMRGCHDNAGFSLTVDQVVQCHSYNKQRRVRGQTDNDGGRISVPARYPMQVFYQQGQTEERLSLSELLDRKSLPAKVLVMSVDEDIEVSTVNVIGRHLTITETHQEVFLRANTISDGWIDQDGIYAIPACFEAEFSVAVGMRGATEDEWIDYYGMFSRSVRHLNFSLLMGYEGIIIEDDGGGALTLEMPINPTLMRRSPGPLYENLGRSQSEKRTSATEPRPSTSRQSHQYENWDRSQFQLQPMLRSKSEKPRSDGRGRPTTLDFEPPKIIMNASDENESPRQSSQDGSRPEGHSSPGTRIETGFDQTKHLPDLISIGTLAQSGQVSPRRPETPFSDEEDDVEEMFRSVLDVAEEQETLKRKGEQEARRLEEQELLFLKRREEENRRKDQVRKQQEQKELARLNSGQEDLTASARKHLQIQNAKNYANLRKDVVEMSPVINPVRSIVEDNRPSYRSSSSSRESGDVEEVSSVHVEVHRDPSPRASTQISTRDKGVKTLTKQFEPAAGSANPNQSREVAICLNQHNGISANNSPPRGTTANMNNNLQSPSHVHKSTPKAIIQPTVQPQHIVTIDVINTNKKQVENGHLSPQSHTDFNANSPRSPTRRSAHNTPKSTLSIKSIDDVPKDLDSLTVEDVCKCLTLLNMDRHLKDFRKHQVDGNLLMSLKETVLINDFKFTPFNSSKLMRFVRGWRPKLA